MIPKELRNRLASELAASDPARIREKTIDVLYALQQHYGFLSDEAVVEAAALLHMAPLEIDELATFYDFLYRQPVGRYVIHVCDGVVCWMYHENSVFDYLCRKLGVKVGEITSDGLFTVLPSACIGDCHHAPAMLINGEFFGPLTPEGIDAILEKFRTEHCKCVICK